MTLPSKTPLLGHFRAYEPTPRQKVHVDGQTPTFGTQPAKWHPFSIYMISFNSQSTISIIILARSTSGSNRRTHRNHSVLVRLDYLVTGPGRDPSLGRKGPHTVPQYPKLQQMWTKNNLKVAKQQEMGHFGATIM